MNNENIKVSALSIWSFGHFLSVKEGCLLVVQGWFVSPCIQCKTSSLKCSNRTSRIIERFKSDRNNVKYFLLKISILNLDLLVYWIFTSILLI